MSGLVDAARTIILAAIVWAGAAGAAVAFVGAVVVGTLALQPSKPRARRCTPVSRPQTLSRDSRDAGTPHRPAESRTAPRVPSWAHPQPISEEAA